MNAVGCKQRTQLHKSGLQLGRNPVTLDHACKLSCIEARIGKDDLAGHQRRDLAIIHHAERTFDETGMVGDLPVKFSAGSKVVVKDHRGIVVRYYCIVKRFTATVGAAMENHRRDKTIFAARGEGVVHVPRVAGDMIEIVHRSLLSVLVIRYLLYFSTDVVILPRER